MSKARIKKKSVAKKKSDSGAGRRDVNRILVENFVSLQKVMTNLSSKFDELSSQISKLLELFEISAKTLARKDFDSEKGNKNSEEMIEKLDNLIDQNKTIARGLTLMHEMNPKKESHPPQLRTPPPQLRTPPLRAPPLRTPPIQEQKTSVEMNKYQKSISSGDEEKI